MFFPCLENLKKEKFPVQSIDMLDWWLGTRRQNTLGSINPLQFSLDCDIDVQHALRLFSFCVFEPEIALLKRKYTVYCPNCSHKVQKSFDIIEKDNLTCRNCNTIVSKNLLTDVTELTFELLKAPNMKAITFNKEEPKGLNRGKASGLRISNMEVYIKEDDDIRRLYDCL